jgi:Nucleotidyl transferase of unknown function (DUF2204)
VPSPLADLLRALSVSFAEIGARWYVFGAQAAIVHGSARLTGDVDVTVELAGRSTGDIVEALARHRFTFRVVDVADFAERTRIIPAVHADTAMLADVVLAGPGLEEQFLDRAEPREVAGVEVPVARAEDVVVMKVLAGRAKDDEDVAAILSARRDSLDFDEIEATLGMLEEALDRSDLVPRLRALRAGRAGEAP